MSLFIPQLQNMSKFGNVIFLCSHAAIPHRGYGCHQYNNTYCFYNTNDLNTAKSILLYIFQVFCIMPVSCTVKKYGCSYSNNTILPS